jgi:hypothetical protein
MSEEYSVVFRSDLGEIVMVTPARYRLLCFGISLCREEMIMRDLRGVLEQTNSVAVGDWDPLSEVSWFSADFGVNNLDRVQQYLSEV